MALVLNHPTVEKLAHELAEAAGETVTEAVMKALEDRLRRVRRGGAPRRRRAPPFGRGWPDERDA
jgi:hypothetical protein